MLAKFNFSPSQMLDKAAAESGEGKKFLGPGLFLTSPVLVISTGLTIFFGTAGLPHILMRFFTVPGRQGRAQVRRVDDRLHRRLHAARDRDRLRRPRAAGRRRATEAVGKGGNLAAPLLAQFLGGGEGTAGGDIALALFSAAAFATILAVVSGLVLASASTIAHDVYASVIRNGEDIDETRVARIASVGMAVFAMAATLLVGSGFNVTVLVSMAFVFAASANFPALVLALTWRRFNTAGALTGVAFGVIASVVMIVLSPPVWPGPDSQGSPSSLTFPGLVTIPIGFLGCWLGTMLAPTREEAAPTTSCSCARRPASAPRARIRAARRAVARSGGRRGHDAAEVGAAAPPASVRAGPCFRQAAGISWLARKISSGSTSALICAQPRVALLAVERDRVRGALGEVEVLAALLVRGDRGADEREVRLERGHDGRVHRDAGGEVQVLAVEAAQRAARVAAERAADVAQLDHQDRRAGARARDASTIASIDLGGEPVEDRRSLMPGHRLLGVHVDVGQPDGRHVGERVHLRPERAQRREQLLGAGRVLADRAVDDTIERPRRNSGMFVAAAGGS